MDTKPRQQGEMTDVDAKSAAVLSKEGGDDTATMLEKSGGKEIESLTSELMLNGGGHGTTASLTAVVSCETSVAQAVAAVKEEEKEEESSGTAMTTVELPTVNGGAGEKETTLVPGDPVLNGGPIASSMVAAAVGSSTVKKEEEETSSDIVGVEEDDIDQEEEALFASLEEQQEKEEVEEALHPHEQPKDICAAPKLLQKALEQGEVQSDESSLNEEEQQQQQLKRDAAAQLDEKKPAAVVISSTTAATTGTKEVATTNAEMVMVPSAAPSAEPAALPAEDGTSSPHKPHAHHRENQLDYLLNKASEYSNFIARDLEELQASMTEQAKKAMAKAEKKAKRKSKSTTDGKEPSSKKRKTSRAGAALLAAEQAKDAKIRTAGSAAAIFMQPENLSKDCQLKDYQLEGVRWLASLYENGISGILADEMGLGKTIQCVALIAHLLTKGVTGPYLIVAPLATLPNWVREFEKWLPQYPVIRYHGTGPEREAMFRGPLNPKHKRNLDFPFIVTSYEVSIRDQAKLEKLCEYTYLIVDEGHRLKNHRCTLLSSLKKFKAKNRLLLTGTPVQNTLQELWSLLHFVNPQIFDDLSVFQSWFGFKDIGQKKQGATDEEDILAEQRKNQTITKLHEILRPFLLRRIKRDVLSELPLKKEVIVYSGISKLQAGYSDLIDKGTLREVLIGQGIENGRTLSQTNKLMNHRKNINHPFLFGEPIDPISGVHLGTAHPQLLVRASGKFALLDRMLDRLFTDGHQVLIFSQMTQVLNVMEDYLRFRQWNFCRIDGSTHIDERQRQMDHFNAEKTSGVNGTRNTADDRVFVFLLSTRAGGLGINLTSADTCIIFDSDWNPFADSQAMDRCHRLGQTRPVAVYRLLTVNSVDIEMMEKQVSKKKLERMTIAGGDFRKAGRRSRGVMSFEHLTNLLQSDIKDLYAKGADVEDIKIDDKEFDMIMDRKTLFAEGNLEIPPEGKMYDVVDAASGDMLDTMH